MKWLLTALALFFVAPAHAQGTLPIAMNVNINQNGQPLAGALLYIYQVNTVGTPQIAFQDIGLTQPLPWPVVADQNGRLPMFYLASGSVHARLTDSGGNAQFDYPNILVINASSAPSGGGGGGTTVDPTSVASTGDVKFRLSSEVLAGWVVLNGQTIGSATSGASGFASSTAQALFIYLWTNCPNAHCPVTPSGRGASALADFSAGKVLQLPDMRDSVMVGRDCMGNTCLGGILLSNITSGGTDTADTPQAFGGVANRTITLTNLPNLSLPVSIGAGQGAHAHTISPQATQINAAAQVGSSGANTASPGAAVTVAATLPAMTGTASLAGSGVALPIMQPFKLGSFYIKL
jgi:hypothetical protein